MKTEIGIICSGARFAEKVIKVTKEVGVRAEIKIGTLSPRLRKILSGGQAEPVEG